MNISEKINFKLVRKIAFLVGAIILMSFSQSLLNYTSKIGMAPLDAFIKSSGKIVGLSYPKMNYIVVFLLVLTALGFSKKETFWITSSALITGLSLAFCVHILSDHIICYLPHLTLNNKGFITTYGYNGIGWGILYFIIGYFLLTLSIGIWINIGFGLRPYEVLQLRVLDRFETINPALFRSLFDLSFIFCSIIFSLISMSVQSESFLETSTVGVGTIIIMSTSGIIIKYWKKLFFFI